LFAVHAHAMAVGLAYTIIYREKKHIESEGESD